MLAQGGAAGGEIVLRLGQSALQALGVVIGRPKAAERQADPFAPNLTIDERKAFRERHLVGQPEQRIRHAGLCVRRVFLQGQDRGEAAIPTYSSLFKGFETKTGPRLRDVSPDIALGLQDGAQLAVVEGRQHLQRFGAAAVGRGVAAQQTRRVRRQSGLQGLPRPVELAHFAGEGRGSLDGAQPMREEAACPIRPADLALGGTSNEADEEVVDEEPPRLHPLCPAAVDLAGHRVRKFRLQRHRDPAAKNVVVNHEARAGHGLQGRVAHVLPVVEVGGFRRLEGKSFEMQALHQRAIPQHHRPLLV